MNKIHKGPRRTKRRNNNQTVSLNSSKLLPLRSEAKLTVTKVAMLSVSWNDCMYLKLIM